jgi:predicted choloylglycine hydrolase
MAEDPHRYDVPPHLGDLPAWVKSLGLPREAADAIDRYWTPVWSSLADELHLLPTHAERELAKPAVAGAETLEFEAVEELKPGSAWRARFKAMWPAYKAWYLQEGDAARPHYPTCRNALEEHMPELLATYDQLVGLAGGGDLPARMLSLYRPPGFIVGCSQGAWTRGAPVLVRNYDYPASRLEGIVCMTQWGRRRVIGMSDCLWGLLDGINDAGLAVSLTFGGRQEVGDGFAIPLVLRYVLETCDTVAEASAALERIPVHAAQNVTLLDREGRCATAYVGPGRPPEIHAIAAAANHQGRIEWPEYARAIRTEERERRVLDLLADEALSREDFLAAFLEPPLHSTSHTAGFGTLYTAAYFPSDGRAEYRWPGETWEQSFDEFNPRVHTQTFMEARRAA